MTKSTSEEKNKILKYMREREYYIFVNKIKIIIKNY